jgi:hypothetical protein
MHFGRDHHDVQRGLRRLGWSGSSRSGFRLLAGRGFHSFRGGGVRLLLGRGSARTFRLFTGRGSARIFRLLTGRGSPRILRLLTGRAPKRFGRRRLRLLTRRGSTRLEGSGLRILPRRGCYGFRGRGLRGILNWVRGLVPRTFRGRTFLVHHFGRVRATRYAQNPDLTMRSFGTRHLESFTATRAGALLFLPAPRRFPL